MKRKYPALSNEPQKVDSSTWYYEERKGVCVIRRITSETGVVIRSEQFYLPWRKLIATVKRYSACKRALARK